MIRLAFFLAMLCGVAATYAYTHFGQLVKEANSNATVDPVYGWVLLIGEVVAATLLFLWLLHRLLGSKFGRYLWWENRDLPGPTRDAASTAPVSAPTAEVAVVKRGRFHQGRVFWVTTGALVSVLYGGALLGLFIVVYDKHYYDPRIVGKLVIPWAFVSMAVILTTVAAMIARHHLQGWDVFVGQWTSRAIGTAWGITVFGAIALYNINLDGLIILGLTLGPIVANQLFIEVSKQMIAAARDEQ
ncbi:hypothetical protein A2704_00375 [Candidatus Kaiserbacteria bacterium RIFCSPHIGHO2_01_FULL_54_36b]|uniref:Uncharacterized protein n=1 Tax=Candidatus Kaiserbacteria bacterium RIFCSPHIGHO2_01_FULL_54_36b TaxID=1798483 RepID=A0A1F6CRP4_9BACT|nr:MAG: hypothetical protein A2704_00375 [Candidatus Kaiserbacteria bacterium RIFCSPHIGHO2_01_FULL_54_36b]